MERISGTARQRIGNSVTRRAVQFRVNTTIAEQIRTATEALLGEVLATASTHMTNRFSRSDG